MRTKLFLTFFAVITLALVSNLIYERLILKDFEDYAMGAEEDRLYWVLASVEGSYSEVGWDKHLLSHPMQWGTMLGYDIVVLDAEGRHVTSSLEALSGITPAMLRRIASMVHLDRPIGEYEEYPLFSAGSEIGYMLIRPLETTRQLGMKEMMFKERGRQFLTISFLIAGGSAVLLSILMSLFLTRPLKRLRAAARRVADGDLSVRVAPGPRDEVGALISSFNTMVESLEREEELRRHLTSNIAHELRTPLAVLRSNLEAVSDGVVPCTPESVSALEAEVERLTNLVRGIEDFTRAEAALLLKSAELEQIVVGEFTSSVANSMLSLFTAKGLALRVDSMGEVEATVDTSKLETVLRNILSNAARHTEEGTVSVLSGPLPEKAFFIEINDTGTGVPEEELRHIFKRFYKGTGSSGTGLGLAIARELTSAMGGRIYAGNLPDGGASFRVELPLKPAE